MIKLLLYCTKAKPYLWQERDENNNKLNNFLTSNIFGKTVNFLNGKIVAECECQKVEEIHISSEKRLGEETKYHIYSSKEDEDLGNYYREDYIEKETCLKCNEISNYLNKGRGYFLHLSNVKVFDKPKDLSEYLIFDGNNTNLNNLKPNQYAPQNMKNVYEFCSDNNILLLPKRTLEKRILISIQPQHLVNILNGKKTIEVRKQILNCLKELI